MTPGVVQFDQQMQQTVTLYKGNTKWNPKYYEFKLLSISNEYGKKTLATASINLAQLASLDPDVRKSTHPPSPLHTRPSERSHRSERCPRAESALKGFCRLTTRDERRLPKRTKQLSLGSPSLGPMNTSSAARSSPPSLTASDSTSMAFSSAQVSVG